MLDPDKADIDNPPRSTDFAPVAADVAPLLYCTQLGACAVLVLTAV